MPGDVLERTHVWLVLSVLTEGRVVTLTFSILDEDGRFKRATFSIDQVFSADYILRLVKRT